jgi:hypothetical protein
VLNVSCFFFLQRKKYLKENPEYLENQRDVNRNLVDMLKKDEGKDVVLQENSGEAQKPGDNYRSLDEKVRLDRCLYSL